MTMLEMMVVIAIIVLLLYTAISGLRRVTKADLTDDTLDFASALRRTSLAAVETGRLHRVVIDFEKNTYLIEVCDGSKTIARGVKAADREVDPKKVQDQLTAAKQRLATATGNLGGAAAPDTAMPGTAEDAAKVAAALAGHHVMDQVCAPAAMSPAPDAKPVPIRQLRVDAGVKFREVWVQHLEESTTAGVVPIYFFPVGSAEKSVIELALGDEVFSVLIHGLTGRVEVKDEALAHPEDHLLRNFKGDKDADR